MSRKFHITTFGCQMNEHDSEIMAGMLQEMGYTPADDRREANILIMNTCSVRENADKRFFGTLGQLKHRREQEDDLIVCVCGCMMQQQHIIDTLKAKYPWVDLVFGTHNIHRLPELLRNVISERAKIIEVPIIFTNRVLGTSKMSGGIFSEAVFGVIKLKIGSWTRIYPKL